MLGRRRVSSTASTNSIVQMARQEISIPIDHDRVNIVSTGRLGKEKGYARLIDICRKLKDEGYAFRLYLIGTGSEEEVLKNQVKSLDLIDDVVFLGYQENPYQFVDKCDLFVCSSYTEGLSTATIEALILGKAILSTEVSGAREILGNNEYGIVTENSDEALYYGSKEYLEHPELIKEYSEKAKQRADIFSVENTVKSAEAVIDSVCSK